VIVVAPWGNPYIYIYIDNSYRFSPWWHLARVTAYLLWVRSRLEQSPSAAQPAHLVRVNRLGDHNQLNREHAGRAALQIACTFLLRTPSRRGGVNSCWSNTVGRGP
jgi:hypothetical protein